MSVLTDLIYGGSNAVAGLTEGAVNAAIEKFGADHPIAFPNTAYYFPTIYAATGVKVKTLGDLVPCVGVLKSLITNQEDLGQALNAGLATAVGAEILEGLKEGGKVYLTVSIRMQAECFQGVISWVPGTMEIELCGALFYDSGDGIWYGDVAASVLYHRAEKRWYLWVCSFAHDHILGHSCFEGDMRFGVNVVDLTLMQKAPEGAPISEFLGFSGDEDPDFFYDEKTNKWLMSICRLDPATRKYRYVFFESDSAFEGYKFIGAGQTTSFFALFFCGIFVAPAQIILDGAGEQHIFLQYHSNGVVQGIQPVFFYIASANQNIAFGGIVQARNQLNQRCFGRTGTA